MLVYRHGLRGKGRLPQSRQWHHWTLLHSVYPSSNCTQSAWLFDSWLPPPLSAFSKEPGHCISFCSPWYPQLRAYDLTDAQYILGRRTGGWNGFWVGRDTCGPLFLTHVNFGTWFYALSWFPSLLIGGHHAGVSIGILSAGPSWIWTDQTIWVLQCSVQIALGICTQALVLCTHYLTGGDLK